MIWLLLSFALAPPKPLTLRLMLAGEEVLGNEEKTWSHSLKVATQEAKARRQPFLILARRWGLSQKGVRSPDGENLLYFWEPVKEKDETFLISRHEVFSKSNSLGATSSIPIAWHQSRSKYREEPKGTRQLLVVSFEALLTQSKPNPESESALYRSNTSIDESLDELQYLGRNTTQIVVCDRGPARNTKSNFLSFPNTNSVKCYEIGFDGSKWFANLEKVYP